MASGLGAIILVLILVKQDVDQAAPELDLLQADAARLEQQKMQQKQSAAELAQSTLAEITEIASIQAKIAALKADLSQTSDVVSQKRMAMSSVKESIKLSPGANKDDVVASDVGGEENYVMGIKVEGPKILFLVDSSASMTDEKLIDIIRRKNSADSEKKSAPKWQRTKRTLRWLIARAPKSSQVAVVAYHKQAKVLGSGGWFSSRDGKRVGMVYSDLDSLIPTGSTNLQHGLQVAAGLKPTDIYLVTDGLPTAGQSRYASLNPFAACGSLLGKSNTISGDCRVKLFRHSIVESAPARGTKVNVILLPIEGDPQAAPEYWRWTAATGGLLISPAASWP